MTAHYTPGSAGTAGVGTCALHDAPDGRCNAPAIYEMDIDRDGDWFPLCVDHGPTYRASTNVRIRTRRQPGVARG